jgi:hypothetical protein
VEHSSLRRRVTRQRTRQRRTGRVLVLAAINAGAMLALGTDARAGHVTWTNPGTAGTWMDAGNWSGGATPANGDDVLLTQSDGVSRTVNYVNPGGVNLNTVQIDSSGSGLMTLRQAQDTLTATDFVVGVNAGGAYELSGGTMSTFRARIGNTGAGTATQTGGLVIAQQFLSIGDQSGGVGRYSISGAGAISARELDIGYEGAGTMEQSGGTVTIAAGNESFLGLGVQPGGRGTYNLTAAARLNAPAAYVGLLGDGSFVQTAGTVSISGVLSLGENIGATGNYTVGGNAQLTAAQMDVGFEGVGSFIQSGNAVVHSGSLNVGPGVNGSGEYLQNGGSLTASDMTVGYNNGSSGVFTLSRGAAAIGTIDLGEIAGSHGTFIANGGLLTAASFYLGGTSTGPNGAGTFNVNTGTVEISGPLKIWSSGVTRFTGGELHAGVLDADGGRFVAGAGAAVVVRADAVAINGGHVDLNDNSMIVDYAPSGPSPRGVPGAPGTIADYIAHGFQGGAWDGAGIVTSVGSIHMGLGYGEARDALGISGAQLGTFMGHTVDASSVLVRYTFYGDSNLDGTVDTLDFNALAGNFGGAGRAWTQADFNYDGVVDTLDFNTFAANFGHSLGAAGGAGASFGQVLVPEPVAATFLLIPALLAGARSSRRGKPRLHH